MYSDILVPTDGTATAEAAIDRAIELARMNEGRIHALAVIDSNSRLEGLEDDASTEYIRTLEAYGRDATVRIQERADDARVESLRHIREGTPYEEILRYVAETDIDAIVMGTQGRTDAERSRIGSTTERVVALADVPVIVVRHNTESPNTDRGDTAFNRIVIATDGSDAAARAAEHGLAIAEHSGAEVFAIYVVDTTTFRFENASRSIVGNLKEGGRQATEAIETLGEERTVPVICELLRGNPTEELFSFAEGIGADLLVLGTRGQTLGSDPFLGSTTSRIIQRSTIPVLTRG